MNLDLDPGGGGGGGGGTRLSCGRGGAAGGRKPDPVAMRSVHKIYTLSQYPLLKKIHIHTLSQYCTIAGAQIAACHKNFGLGSPEK